jgi:hypothetical protein
VALVGTFVALTATSYAAVAARNSVTSLSIRNGQVMTADLRANSVTSAKIKNGQILGADLRNGAVTGAKVAANTLTGSQIDESTLAAVPTATALANTVRYNERLVASDQLATATFTEAEAAAPTTTLATFGAFKVTAKCFIEDEGGTATLHGYAYVESTVDGAIFDADGDERSGDGATNQFLNIATPLADRSLDNVSITVNDADMQGEGDSEWSLVAPDGTKFVGTQMWAAKYGTLVGGDGPYGAGNSCHYWGDVRQF